MGCLFFEDWLTLCVSSSLTDPGYSTSNCDYINKSIGTKLELGA